MFDRQGGSPPARKACRPGCESLEGRQLLNASIEPIANITVPQTVGFQVPVMAGPGAPASQTFTVQTSDNNVSAKVAQGKFLTINVTHTASGPTDITFSGAMTFQLFDDLTPLTTSRIEQLVQGGFYTNNNFFRVASGFPDAQHFIVQGGSADGMGDGVINAPGFPFQDEFVQQLVYTGSGQLAMANAFGGGGFDTNSSQFFITTGQPRFLDFTNPIFGQLVSGFDILTDMTKVAVTTGNPADPTPSKPVSPINITSATLSNTNPNGVIYIDAKGAQVPGVTNVTVTATDPTTHTTSSQTFQVTVAANTMNERPIVAVVNNDQFVLPNGTFTLQLNASDAEPTDTLTYNVVGGIGPGGTSFVTAIPNATASVTSTGLVTVTPNKNFQGNITFFAGARDQVDHSGTGMLDIPLNYDMHKITLHVTNQAGGVRVIKTANSNVLVVTPPPRTDKLPNTIVIDEMGGNLVVNLNGATSGLQPPASGITQIVVYGAKANDAITVTPNVDTSIPVTLDGGHGGFNIIKAGNGDTREHGWFGFNVLQGGNGNDALIGRKGHVHFIKSAGNDLLYAGVIPPLRDHSTHHIKVRLHQFRPPSGTFYTFVGNQLVPVRVANEIEHEQAVKTKTTTTTTTTTPSANTQTARPAVKARPLVLPASKPRTGA